MGLLDFVFGPFLIGLQGLEGCAGCDGFVGDRLLRSGEHDGADNGNDESDDDGSQPLSSLLAHPGFLQEDAEKLAKANEENHSADESDNTADGDLRYVRAEACNVLFDLDLRELDLGFEQRAGFVAKLA